MTAPSREALRQAVELVEEAYEFTLAYAAQGMTTDEASRSGAQLRDLLGRADRALGELADLFAAVIREADLTPAESFADFVAVLREDARKARAAVRLTLDQPSISSQLVDNLNASIHVRALLTDLFLLDEVIAARTRETRPG